MRIYRAQGQWFKRVVGQYTFIDVSQWTNGVYVVQSQSIMTGKEGRVSFVKQ